MKVSLISTVYNEESSIEQFLNGLLGQFYIPDEIIIVDGGSKDNTVEIIDAYIEKGMPIKLIIEKGANISRGRNIAIKNAKYDIIASTDGGCKLDHNWLKNMLSGFDKGIDVVGGATIPSPRNDFEKCVVEVTLDVKNAVNEETFLPSARSIAFTKSAWEKVGGYPEHLYTAEDTLFDINLRKAGFRFKFVESAKVYWDVRKNFKQVFKQNYLYSKGNAEANLYKSRNFFSRFLDLLGLVAVLIFIPHLNVYILPWWIIIFLIIYRTYISSGLRCFALNKTLKSLFYGIFLKFTLDISIFVGMVRGMIGGVLK